MSSLDPGSNSGVYFLSLLVLIPWPETSWSAAGRVTGRTSIPLTDQGRIDAERWAEGLKGLDIKVVFSPDDSTSVETAKIISARCSARHKVDETLREVDFGLWGGLTLDELKRRFPKIFKKWYDDPTSVCPPEGEDVGVASVRLTEALGRIRKKQRNQSLAFVLGPLALAIARCDFEAADLAGVRGLMRSEPMRYTATEGDSILTVSSASPACPDTASQTKPETVRPSSCEGDHGAG